MTSGFQRNNNLEGKPYHSGKEAESDGPQIGLSGMLEEKFLSPTHPVPQRLELVDSVPPSGGSQGGLWSET